MTTKTYVQLKGVIPSIILLTSTSNVINRLCTELKTCMVGKICVGSIHGCMLSVHCNVLLVMVVLYMSIHVLSDGW